MQEKLEKIQQAILSLTPSIAQKIRQEFVSYRAQAKKGRVNKGAQDITIAVDHSIGKLLIDNVFTKYTRELTFDSEEKAERIGSGPIVLRVDPLDGTKHFSEGLPEIASCVSLVYANEVKFGLVINPFTNDVFCATKGQGAFLNSKKITVSNKLIDDDFSFVMYEPPNAQLFMKRPNEFIALTNKLVLLQQKAYRMRNVGLASLSICYVAAGISPLYIDLSKTTKIYDAEAAILIAQEAGATVGTIFGNKLTGLTAKQTDKKHVDECVLIGNPLAWQQTIDLLQN